YAASPLTRPPSLPTRRSSDLFRPSRGHPALRRVFFRLAADRAAFSTDSGEVMSRRESLSVAVAPDRLSFGFPDIGKPKLRRSGRSEEHTSELQSHLNLVCRLL